MYLVRVRKILQDRPKTFYPAKLFTFFHRIQIVPVTSERLSQMSCQFSFFICLVFSLFDEQQMTHKDKGNFHTGTIINLE